MEMETSKIEVNDATLAKLWRNLHSQHERLVALENDFSKQGNPLRAEIAQIAYEVRECFLTIEEMRF